MVNTHQSILQNY